MVILDRAYRIDKQNVLGEISIKKNSKTIISVSNYTHKLNVRAIKRFRFSGEMAVLSRVTAR
jgi:IS4 transposase